MKKALVLAMGTFITAVMGFGFFGSVPMANNALLIIPVAHAATPEEICGAHLVKLFAPETVSAFSLEVCARAYKITNGTGGSAGALQYCGSLSGHKDKRAYTACRQGMELAKTSTSTPPPPPTPPPPAPSPGGSTGGSGGSTGSTKADTFCEKEYKDSSAEARAVCKEGYVSGYKEGGASKTAVCDDPGRRAGLVVICERGYDEGHTEGVNDRRAARRAAGDGCPDDQVRVSGGFGFKSIGVDDKGRAIYCTPANKNPIYALLSVVIKFISGLIGLAMVLTVVLSGLQYILSNGSSDATKAAKDRLWNALWGFLLFVSMIALLQFLLPPGLKPLFG